MSKMFSMIIRTLCVALFVGALSGCGSSTIAVLDDQGRSVVGASPWLLGQPKVTVPGLVGNWGRADSAKVTTSRGAHQEIVQKPGSDGDYLFRMYREGLGLDAAGELSLYEVNGSVVGEWRLDVLNTTQLPEGYNAYQWALFRLPGNSRMEQAGFGGAPVGVGLVPKLLRAQAHGRSGDSDADLPLDEAFRIIVEDIATADDAEWMVLKRLSD